MCRYVHAYLHACVEASSDDVAAGLRLLARQLLQAVPMADSWDRRLERWCVPTSRPVGAAPLA